MVIRVAPVKFYGNGLPRPRVYTDVKLNTERVDPPVPVTDPLLSWAKEAHWSMGGHSFSRVRLQGRIEGNVDRLRKFREKNAKQDSPVAGVKSSKELKGNERVVARSGEKKSGSVSPPPAPKVIKQRKRRFMDLFDEESEWEEDENENDNEIEANSVVGGGKKKLARKLVGDFDKVHSRFMTKRRTVEVERNDRVRDLVVEDANRDDSNGKKRASRPKVNEKSPSNVRTSPRLLAARNKSN